MPNYSAIRNSLDEILESIEDIKNELPDDDEEDEVEEASETHNTFYLSLSELDAIVRHAGGLTSKLFKPNDVIVAPPFKWRVIAVGADNPLNCPKEEQHVTLQVLGYITDGTPFDDAGHNDWAKSSMRKYLEDVFLKKLLPADAACVKYVEKLTGEAGNKTVDRVFLLSAKELGFDVKEAGSVYPLFTGYSASEHRLYKDDEGDNRWYFTRSPNPGNALIVRYVNTDGSLNSTYAYIGLGAVPACIVI